MREAQRAVRVRAGGSVGLDTVEGGEAMAGTQSTRGRGSKCYPNRVQWMQS